MRIGEFVKETLTEIERGVRVANEEASAFYPAEKDDYSGRNVFSMYGQGQHGISFDIAVTVKTAGSGGGGAEIAVLGIGLKAGGKAEQANEAVSRVSFQVNIHKSIGWIPSQKSGLQQRTVDPD